MKVGLVERTFLQILGPDNTSICLTIVGKFNPATFLYLARFAEFQAKQLEDLEAAQAPRPDAPTSQINPGSAPRED